MRKKNWLFLMASLLLTNLCYCQETIYSVVDTPPEFPGGLAAFYDYVDEHLVYPQLARKNKIEGSVFVEFIVEDNGEVTQVRVLKGLSGRCDAEALRVLKDTPNFKPGVHGGKPVRVKLMLPIKFSLDDDQGRKSLLTERERYRPPANSLDTALNDMSVRQLALEHQQLGVLDHRIGRAQQLKYLNLTDNQLKILPDEIGGLSNLEELFLTYNQLTGLPDTFSQLSALRTLYLDRNLLREFPLVLLDLPSLETLDISFTQISLIPSEIAKMPKLKIIYARGTTVSSNQIAALRKINPRLEILK